MHKVIIMNTDSREKKSRHPIGVVSRRTGLGLDVIRAWERRYGVVRPQRTDTGRRLYSDEDIQHLLLLKRVVDGGRRISDVAGMSTSELENLAREDQAAAPQESVRMPVDAKSPLEDAVDAATRLEGERLKSILSEAALTMSAPEMRRKLIAPLLTEIGERWREGTVRVAHEHLATLIVRTFVDGMRTRAISGDGQPRILITTTAGQRHELGALMAAVAAEEVGWKVIYLGSSLPAEEIGAAARQSKARAVGLSVVFHDNLRTAEELRAIRRYLSDDVVLVVGGRAAAELEDIIIELGGHRIDDMLEFQSLLDSIRGSVDE
jgi:DNA-binding transcriptional MerR regulator/methylmalonyl-CoA mutase cobalamin-binding subunit